MNNLLKRWGDVPGFHPYMNNKYVHIGHGQIFQLLIVSAWVLNLKLAENQLIFIYYYYYIIIILLLSSVWEF